MKCEELLDILEVQSPVSMACDWDNVGLLVGTKEKEVRKIYIALDATDEVIEAAIKNGVDVLLTHHPLIFKGMKRIVSEDFIGRRIVRLVQADISYIAMHTNFDVCGMADLAADKAKLKDCSVLDVTGERDGILQGIGRVGRLKEAMVLSEYISLIKKAFSLEQVKIFGDVNSTVKTVAISPGSGKSVIDQALSHQADVLVTGDIDHHEGIDAVARGMAVVDAGHYGLEHIFVDYMKEYLERQQLGVDIITHPLTFPFAVM